MTSQVTDYKPILCGDYDFLEIACMESYKIVLDVDGCSIVGTARDMEVRSLEEFLVIEHEDGVIEKIRIDRIRRLAVRSRPCRFEMHVFSIAP